MRPWFKLWTDKFKMKGKRFTFAEVNLPEDLMNVRVAIFCAVDILSNPVESGGGWSLSQRTDSSRHAFISVESYLKKYTNFNKYNCSFAPWKRRKGYKFTKDLKVR